MPLMDLELEALREEGARIDQITRSANRNVRASGGGGRMAWLDAVHPIYERYHDAWERNERRLRGGEDVLDELRRFDWEALRPVRGQKRTQYEVRRDRATYVPFADMYATTVVGHIMRQRPQPGAGGALSFGTLGEVRRERDFNTPTRAEMIYYNADGVGNDGSQWDNFWGDALKRAMATGHRWIMVESPAERATNFAEMMSGRRPYLVEMGPQQVPWWHYDEGVLQGAIVRVPDERPRVNSRGQMEGTDGGEGYLVLARYGFEGFGSEYRDGGWWLYDRKKKLLRQGRWLNTRGEIPFFPLFYERDKGTRERPAFSRAALTELGALGVAYMDMESARLFDVWDAAMSVTYLLGVSREGFNLATEKLAEGSRVVPVPINTEHASGAVVPTVADGSTGSVAAASFDSLNKSMLETASRIGFMHATGTPDASGLSKVAGWNEEKSPRMALAASHLEQAQNTAIHFLELRWGFPAPRGSTTWTRKFDLIALVDEIRGIFELERLSGLRSKTLGATLMVAAAEDRGFLTDDAEKELVRGEYEAAGQAAADQQQALATMALDAGQGADEFV